MLGSDHASSSRQVEPHSKDSIVGRASSQSTVSCHVISTVPCTCMSCTHCACCVKHALPNWRIGYVICNVPTWVHCLEDASTFSAEVQALSVALALDQPKPGMCTHSCRQSQLTWRCTAACRWLATTGPRMHAHMRPPSGRPSLRVGRFLGSEQVLQARLHPELCSPPYPGCPLHPPVQEEGKGIGTTDWKPTLPNMEGYVPCWTICSA